MDHYRYRLTEIPIGYAKSSKEVELFLATHNLKLDDTLEQYFGVYCGSELVGGAGYGGKVIKCVAVDPDHRGEGIVNALISQIVTKLHQKGIQDLFLFTKPNNAFLFENLHFFPVAQTDQVLLLESDKHAFSTYLKSLPPLQLQSRTGAIVMNCNPFTLGHQYLIETAAAQCDQLIIFAVEEDVSVFPFSVRIQLMREGVAHLPNVTVISGGAYVISFATFPTYFITDEEEVSTAHARLDVHIFGKYIAPTSGISIRFAGEEPYSPVTNLYNQAMLEILPPLGVTVEIIPRKAVAGDAISASRVRRLLAEGNTAQARLLVPDTTWRYLTSEDALPVIEKLRNY